MWTLILTWFAVSPVCALLAGQFIAVGKGPQ